MAADDIVGSLELETVKAALAATEWDLEREEDRMKNIDSKLSQLAAFSGVSISISGGLGGSILAAGRLGNGFLIALGACVATAGVLLLIAVVVSFRGLSPKLYRGAGLKAVRERVGEVGLKRSPQDAMVRIAGGRLTTLDTARALNKRKARAATRAFTLVSVGFALIVAALLVTAVGSVV